MATYVTKNDVELIFGKLNVEQWCNLEGNTSTDKKNARVSYFCGLASGEIEDILRDRRYKFPLTVSATLKDLVAKLTGIRLHDARGVIDNEVATDAVSKIREEVETKISRIRNGEVYLEGERYSTAPNVVNDPNSHPRHINPDFDPMRPYFGLRHD